MKRCDDVVNDFPDVAPGDTVEDKDGDVYLVTEIPRLFNLRTGNIWNGSDLWGNSYPGHWKKVECCFKVVQTV